MRNAPDVAARIQWVLKERVEAETRTYARRQKSRGDLLARALSKLDDIMSTDLREVVDWRREAVTNAAGEVTGISETVAVKDAAKISPKAASAIKGVFMKAGQVRIEMHDQRAAAVEIIKLLSGSDAQPTTNVTVNQTNIGATDALDAARRVAFLLGAAMSRLPAAQAATSPLTIEGEASKT